MVILRRAYRNVSRRLVRTILVRVVLALCIAVLVSISTLLMAVTTPQDITDGMERILKPLSILKVPVGDAALIISIALRFVPVLTQEAQKIQKAQCARGADLEGPWWIRIRKSIPMILPLFAGALKRADTLALALEARGYGTASSRTRMMVMKLRVADAVAFAATCSVILILLFLQYRI